MGERWPDNGHRLRVFDSRCANEGYDVSVSASKTTPECLHTVTYAAVRYRVQTLYAEPHDAISITFVEL